MSHLKFLEDKFAQYLCSVFRRFTDVPNRIIITWWYWRGFLKLNVVWWTLLFWHYIQNVNICISYTVHRLAWWPDELSESLRTWCEVLTVNPKRSSNNDFQRLKSWICKNIHQKFPNITTSKFCRSLFHDFWTLICLVTSVAQLLILWCRMRSDNPCEDNWMSLAYNTVNIRSRWIFILQRDY